VKALRAVWGEGGLNPLQGRPCNRPSPHAQIFFLSAGLLIIVFEIKQSNGGALSPARQCQSSQALRCRSLVARRWAGWNPRIYFRNQSGRTRGAAKSSASPRSGTAWLIRTQNLEIKYRKPTTRCHGIRGGFNPAGLVGPGGGSTHFREIRIYFFLRLTSTASGEDTQKIAAKFRVGGVGRAT
jgi:hypothetical protein